jgi:class 3 adenylate cyclase/tetratricopeptide (TPR) repeat protein
MCEGVVRDRDSHRHSKAALPTGRFDSPSRAAPPAPRVAVTAAHRPCRAPLSLSPRSAARTFERPADPRVDRTAQIEATIAGLEAQRPHLGDALVDAALAPLRQRLDALNAAAGGAPERQSLRQVSVLFMDVVGSTTLSRRLDPEDIHAVMDGLLARCTAQVETHGGKVLQYAATACSPRSARSARARTTPSAAVRAGPRAARRRRARRRGGPQRFGHAVSRVRVGVHTGEVLLGGGVDADGSIRGITVNVAARMEQSAPPGGLRISDDTCRLVRGAFETERQAPDRGEGPRPVRSSPTWSGGRGDRAIAARARHRGARDADGRPRCRARRAAARVRAPRPRSRRQLVTVIGEAGLGKSRLLDEFQAWLGARPDAAWCSARGLSRRRRTSRSGCCATCWRRASVSTTPTAWRRRSGGSRARRAVVRGRRRSRDPPRRMRTCSASCSASTSPTARTCAASSTTAADPPPRPAGGTQLVLRLARQREQPMVLWLDDLHWADDGTLDFVEQLARASGRVPLLILALARPALGERRAGRNAIEALDVATDRIELRPLDEVPSHRLADALLAPLGDVPVDLRESICGRADGNPFYMEELVKMLDDQGVIATGAAGWRLVRERLDATAVPKTLTGVLQARLDHPAPAERRALQQAAVVGPAFPAAALAAVDADAIDALPVLERRGLVVRGEGAQADALGAYRFGHQLLHQVVYASLLRGPRRRAHAQVAAWLVAQHGARANDFLGATADHFERAGDLAQAAEYHARAVEHAGAVHAHESALVHAARALALVEGDSSASARALQWRVRAVRERTFDRLGRRAEHGADLDALDAIASVEDDDRHRADVLKRRSYYALRIGDTRMQERTAREAMTLAGRCGAVEIRLRAQNLLATALSDLGQVDEGRALATAGIAEARAHGMRRVEGSFLNSLSVMATQQDDVAALDASQRQWEMFRDMGDRPAEAVSVMHLGIALLGVGERVRAKAHLVEGLRLTRAVGDRAMEPYALTYLALIAWRDGDPEAARRHAEEARAISVDVAIRRPRSSRSAGSPRSICRRAASTRRTRPSRGRMRSRSPATTRCASMPRPAWRRSRSRATTSTRRWRRWPRRSRASRPAIRSTAPSRAS